MELSLEEAVLIAVARGADTIDKLSSLLRVSKKDIIRVIEELEIKGLIRFEKTGWWIFRRKVIRLTKDGFIEASKAFKKAEKVADKIREEIKAMNKDNAREFINTWGFILPLLTWLELIDLTFLDPLLLDMLMHDGSIIDIE